MESYELLLGMWPQTWHSGTAADQQQTQPIQNVPAHQQQDMEMLQMLGQSDQNSFEDLNMFNSFNE